MRAIKDIGFVVFFLVIITLVAVEAADDANGSKRAAAESVPGDESRER